MKFATALLIASVSLTAQIPHSVKWANSKSCPAKILGSQMGGSAGGDIFSNVALANADSRVITAIQFGWVISDSSLKGGVIRYSNLIKVNATKGVMFEVANLGASMDETARVIASLKVSSGVITLGVTRLTFDDGSEWNFHFGPDARFSMDQTDKEAAAPFIEQLNQFIELKRGGERSRL